MPCRNVLTPVQLEVYQLQCRPVQFCQFRVVRSVPCRPVQFCQFRVVRSVFGGPLRLQLHGNHRTLRLSPSLPRGVGSS